MEITVDALRWALTATLKAASKDPVRHALCGVCFERPEADEDAPIPIRAGMLRLIGTDGHRLHVADIAALGDLALPARGVTLDRAACERLLKALPKTGKKGPAPSVDLAFRDDAAHARIGADTLLIPVLAERFPDWRQVVPTIPAKAPAERMGFDPDYLAAACAVAPGGCLQIHTPEDLSPMLLTSQNPDLGMFTAVVMPMRI